MTRFETLLEVLENQPGACSAAEYTAEGCTEHRFAPSAGAHNCYSISKSVTGCALGILCDRGVLRDTDTLYIHIGGLFPREYDRRWEQVTLRDICLHRTGTPKEANIDVDTMDFYGFGAVDFLEYVLGQPIVYEPGKGPFVYSDTNYYMISRVIEEKTGMTAADFLQLNMFTPLRFRGNAWGSCPLCHTLGGTGLFLTPRDLAAYGYMLACGGEFEGKRVLSAEWIDKARGEPDGYGYGLSNSDDGRWFAAYGMYSQAVYIFPSTRSAVAVFGHNVDQDIVRSRVIPLYL